MNGTFVGDIVASEASRGTAYVSFDAHRDGDFAPYIFKTTDFGKTWQAVVSGLPSDDASIRGLAEYEKMLDQVAATPDGLRASLFPADRVPVARCVIDSRRVFSNAPRV